MQANSNGEPEVSLVFSSPKKGTPMTEVRIEGSNEHGEQAIQSRLVAPGDSVQFNDKVRPKYLRGTQGSIVLTRKSRLVIVLSEPAGNHNAGDQIVAPVAAVKNQTYVSISEAA